MVVSSQLLQFHTNGDQETASISGHGSRTGVSAGASSEVNLITQVVDRGFDVGAVLELDLCVPIPNTIRGYQAVLRVACCFLGVVGI